LLAYDILNGLFNWTYKDIVAVLLANGFSEQTSHTTSGTSHHYFIDEPKKNLVHVQFHGKKSIRPKTMESVILQSGMPKSYWLKASKMNKKTLKKNPYEKNISSV
jgi:predicted RNA binding protein YcfA (HicA-like mRNA interferase family)